MKLFDSELKIMEVLWRSGDTPARVIARTLEPDTGWNVNTTYTLIKRLIAKGAIARREPRFVCHALVAKAQVQQEETRELIEKIFDGSPEQLFASLLGRERLSAEQIEQLRQIVEDWE